MYDVDYGPEVDLRGFADRTQLTFAIELAKQFARHDDGLHWTKVGLDRLGLVLTYGLEPESTIPMEWVRLCEYYAITLPVDLHETGLDRLKTCLLLGRIDCEQVADIIRPSIDNTFYKAFQALRENLKKNDIKAK